MTIPTRTILCAALVSILASPASAQPSDLCTDAATRMYEAMLTALPNRDPRAQTMIEKRDELIVEEASNMDIDPDDCTLVLEMSDELLHELASLVVEAQ